MGLQWSREEERRPLLAGSRAPRVFGRRWLVLLLFSLLGFMQGLVWNSWGPIQNSARAAYGFQGLDIALLVLWGPIGFLPCFLFMWLMDTRGLRVTVLLTLLCMVLGAGLRCIPVSDLALRRRLIHGGQLLNGFAGPTAMNAAPFLSTTWFSPDERATATAIASMLNYLGGACAFLIGPLIVPAPNNTSGSHLTEGHVESIKDRIEAVMYTEFGVIALLFAAVVAYFPARPPIPPSVAAAGRRLSYRSSVWRLLSNVRFLMIVFAYAIPLGFYAGWSGVLDLILTPIHINQVDAGWIGFWSIVGGCFVGIAVGRFADSVRGVLKPILVLLFSASTLSATWFTLTFLSRVTHLPLTTATIYTSCILIGVFLNGTVPIFFEMFVETVYPVPEGITCGFVTFLSNIFTGLLLVFLTFYHIELSWLNWCLTGSCFLSLLFIVCFRESYDRLYLDVFISV
ncbi:solute carrier family 49 member 4 isoform X1 [Engystomops pustulosus]|uniref:solute carrier family 49 member 4 isoform X1 n=1 Tax=Engystomops pustulosus TaxID=76066 RepID=UPI003AFB0981